MQFLSAQTVSLREPGSAARDENFAGGWVRELRDPHTGLHWTLEKNQANPGGPGRMRLAAKDGRMESKSIVIRTGDRIVVEEHTAAVEGSLEATALGSAAAGSRFNTRLKIGNKVVRAVALAPGKAALVRSPEVRP